MRHFNTFKPEFKKAAAIFEIKTSNISKCKVSYYKKRTKFRTKIVLFGYFWTGICKKTIVVFEIIQNGTIMKLGPKLFYFSNFRPEFEKAITIFEISSFKFVKIKSFMLKKKILIKIEIYGYF